MFPTLKSKGLAQYLGNIIIAVINVSDNIYWIYVARSQNWTTLKGADSPIGC